MNPYGELAMRALDFQLDLLAFHTSKTGLEYTSSLGAQMHVRQPKVVGGFAAYALDLADTYALTDEIGDLVEAGAATIPNYALHAEDVPTRGGLVVLETPKVLMDGTGKPLAVKAMMWFKSVASKQVEVDEDGDEVRQVTSFNFVSETGPKDLYGERLPGPPDNDEPKFALTTFLFTDPNDPRDHMYAEHQAYREDARLNDGGRAILRAPALAMFCGAWLEGEEADLDLTKFLAAFFRFVSTEYVERRAILPPKAAVKRARRFGWTRSAEVRLVRLRKEFKRRTPGDDVEGAGTRTYSHRWLVRGHWRMQWYAKQGRHAPKWIAGYEKGPEGATLLVTDRVFQVDR